MGAINMQNIDCMEFMRLQPNQAYDLAIVDPPYFNGPNKSGYYGKGYSSIGVQRAKHYDSLTEWAVPDSEYFAELKRVSKNQIIWGANHFANAFDCSGPGWIVWDKDNGASSFADVELAYSSFDKAARIFRYERIHPTQKPVALYDWLLHKYASPGQKILDTHSGSGSIAIACEKFGASLDACEIDPVMYAAACDRYREFISVFTAQPDLELFCGGGSA